MGTIKKVSKKISNEGNEVCAPLPENQFEDSNKLENGQPEDKLNNKVQKEEMTNKTQNLENVAKEKRELYMKVQNIIKNARIEKYMQDRDNIAKEGLTFWGALTGKNSLQIQRIENIKLKIELLQTQKIEEKEEYTATDMLADIYSCAISELNGRFTEQMKSMYEKIKHKYPNEVLSDDEIYKLVCDKVENSQDYLPIIHKENAKGIFGDIKVQINFFKMENKKLKNQIVIERGRSQFETFKEKIIPLKATIMN